MHFGLSIYLFFIFYFFISALRYFTVHFCCSLFSLLFIQLPPQHTHTDTCIHRIRSEAFIILFKCGFRYLWHLPHSAYAASSLTRSFSVCTGKKVKLISIKWAAVRCGERMRIFLLRHTHTHMTCCTGKRCVF